jgi:uncharacterized membrane protein YfcA
VDELFLAASLGLGVVSGATAAVVGFGIGSLMTPLFAASLGANLAVATVTLPHLIATALRCYRLRRDIDRRVLVRFGAWSASGGLAGALVYSRLGAPLLSGVLGVLLIMTAVANITGLFERRSPHGASTALLGLGSGFCGGLAGNQGGLRAAALSAFGLTPRSFVATSTATGLLVDLARTPVYAAVTGGALLGVWRPIAFATVGVLVGTLLGERVLFGLSPLMFKRLLAVAVGLLGGWLLFRSFQPPF